jgi:hypothetical protein
MVQTLLLSSVVAALVYLAAVAVAAVAFALKHGGRREDPVDDHDALGSSRFTIPVSLIVPLSDATPSSAASVRRTASSRDFFADVLNLHYPEFEVIVVADEQHPSLDALKADWGFSAHEFFYRQSLTTAEVRRIYRSSRDPRLMLVEKRAAGRADAVNCGVNLTRYRYAGVVDADVTFAPDALLRAMSAPLRDPASVVAASSHVESGGDNAWERLVSTRSRMESLLVWRRLTHGFGPAGGVVVWRRDALLQMRGFSTTAADPDLDMMMRLQTASPASDGGARPAVVRTPEVFGVVESRSRATVLRAMARRQQAALEALGTWAVRGGQSADAKSAVAYLAASQVVTPLAMGWVVAATAASAAAGWLPWRDVALSVILLSLGQAAATAAALFLHGSDADALDGRALTRLLLVAPCEFALCASGAAYARVSGVWHFVRQL